MKAAVLCLGEVMVDWVCYGLDGQRVPLSTNFILDAAGTPANVAVGLKRQGVDSAIIGCIGADWLGKWLQVRLEDMGIGTSNLISAEPFSTRVAYVERLPDGERATLGFTSAFCADRMLVSTDLQPDLFTNAQAFYFGSTSLSAEPIITATRAAIALAQKNNVLVVSDSNIWPAMWGDNNDLCRETVLEFMSFVDMLKVNRHELEFLTGCTELLVAATKFRSDYELPLLLVTLGAEGTLIVSAGGERLVPPCPTNLVEAAGAGDAFVAGTLAALLPHLAGSIDRRKTLSTLDLDLIVAAVKRGNASGAIVCSRVGALSAMPTSAEVEAKLLES